MIKPKAVLFDLDETLAESKQPITDGMATLLVSLLEQVPVAIVSGGKFDVLVANVSSRIPETSRARLYLAPTCGAGLYEWNDGYRAVYEETLTDDEAATIVRALEEAVAETGGIDFDAPSHGERIELRGSQVTLSALGQFAPIEDKKAWDPDRSKRIALKDAVAKRIPEFDVKTGGSTSIDVTKPGVHKGFGVVKFGEHLSLPVSDMLYIGDALYEGGNDEIVKETGIPTRQTSGPAETADIIRELLS